MAAFPEYCQKGPGIEESLRPLAASAFGNAIFSLEKIGFAYPSGRQVLKDLDLALFPGQVLGLRGLNGSGKTTLFRCITGLLKPQTGIIRLGGRIVRKEKDFNALRCQVGFVLQDAEDQLFFPSVLEDLAFGPLNLGQTRDEAARIARASLALVGLSGFEERLVHQLSGGEKKLVALAAILAMRPRALLLDEPLNGLDGNARQKVADVIAGLACAKIIISHDHDFLREIGAASMTLENGRLERLPSEEV